MKTRPAVIEIKNKANDIKVTLYNLLCQRVFSLLSHLSDADQAKAERELIPQFKAWKKFNKVRLAKLLSHFNVMTDFDLLGTSNKPELDREFDACATEIASKINDVFQRTLLMRVVQNHFRAHVTKKREIAQKFTSTIRALPNPNKDLLDYLAQYDNYLSTILSSYPTLLHAINQIMAEKNSDDQYSESSMILLGLAQKIVGVDEKNKSIGGWIKSTVIKAVLPNYIDQLNLPDKQTKAIAVIAELMMKLAQNYREADNAFRQLTPSFQNALSCCSAAVKPLRKMINEMVNIRTDEIIRLVEPGRMVESLLDTKEAAEKYGRMGLHKFKKHVKRNVEATAGLFVDWRPDIKLINEVYSTTEKDVNGACLRSLYNFHLFLLILIDTPNPSLATQSALFNLYFEARNLIPDYHFKFNRYDYKNMLAIAPVNDSCLRDEINIEERISKAQLVKIMVRLDHMEQQALNSEFSHQVDQFSNDIQFIVAILKNPSKVDCPEASLGSLEKDTFQSKIFRVTQCLSRTVCLPVCLRILKDEPEMARETRSKLSAIYHRLNRVNLKNEKSCKDLLSKEDCQWLLNLANRDEDKEKLRKMVGLLGCVNEHYGVPSVEIESSDVPLIRSREDQVRDKQIESIKITLALIQPKLLIDQLVEQLQDQANACDEFPGEKRLKAKSDYCKNLIIMLNDFKRKVLSDAGDYSQLAKDFQAFLSQTPNLGSWLSFKSLLDVADHFGPTNEEVTQGCLHSLFSFILKQCDHTKVDESHSQFQIALNQVNAPSIKDRWLREELLDPHEILQSGLIFTPTFLVKYINALADYFQQSTNQSDFLKLIRFGRYNRILNLLTQTVFTRDRVIFILKNMLGLSAMNDSPQEPIAYYFFKFYAYFQENNDLNKSLNYLERNFLQCMSEKDKKHILFNVNELFEFFNSHKISFIEKEVRSDFQKFNDAIAQLLQEKKNIDLMFDAFLVHISNLINLLQQIRAKNLENGINQCVVMRRDVLLGLNALYRIKGLRKKQQSQIKDIFQQINDQAHTDAKEQFDKAKNALDNIGSELNSIDHNHGRNNMRRMGAQTANTWLNVFLTVIDILSTAYLIYNFVQPFISGAFNVLDYIANVAGLVTTAASTFAMVAFWGVLAVKFIITLGYEIYLERKEFQKIWQEEPNTFKNVMIKLGKTSLLVGLILLKSVVKTIFSSFAIAKLIELYDKVKESWLVKCIINFINKDKVSADVLELKTQADKIEADIKSLEENISINRLQKAIDDINTFTSQFANSHTDTVKENVLLKTKVAEFTLIRKQLEYVRNGYQDVEALSLGAPAHESTKLVIEELQTLAPNAKQAQSVLSLNEFMQNSKSKTYSTFYSHQSDASDADTTAKVADNPSLMTRLSSWFFLSSNKSAKPVVETSPLLSSAKTNTASTI